MSDVKAQLRAVGRAKANVAKAQAELDAVLIAAVDAGVHSDLLRDVLGDDEPMARATYFRRLREARGETDGTVVFE